MNWDENNEELIEKELKYQEIAYTKEPINGLKVIITAIKDIEQGTCAFNWFKYYY